MSDHGRPGAQEEAALAVVLGEDPAPRGLSGWAVTIVAVLAGFCGPLVAAAALGGPGAIPAVLLAAGIVLGAVALGSGVRLSFAISPAVAWATAFVTYVLLVLVGALLLSQMAPGGGLAAAVDARWLGGSLLSLVLPMLAGAVTDHVRSGRAATARSEGPPDTESHGRRPGP